MVIPFMFTKAFDCCEKCGAVFTGHQNNIYLTIQFINGVCVFFRL